MIPAVAAHLATRPNLILQAPPGSGKTTRVPPALLDQTRGQILVLEPRRLAARLAARRVAAELGESVGQTIGYQVRFEDVGGPTTRLRYLTEGVLTRRLLDNPRLNGVSVVVLDEFHERHLDGDLALALLLRLQATARPDLRLIVMSATLDAAPLASRLGGCEILRAEGRLFDLEITHTPHSPAPLEQQIAAAVERLLGERHTGDILAFLPGAAEIARSSRACDAIAQRAGLLLTSLHGDLSPADQDRAVSRADRQKLILSTNVAESSVTIEGVTAVIDSGLARIAIDSPWTGLPSLNVARISQASAIQRAGRAARTAPGRVIRLYSLEDFHRRPAHDVAEIHRRELSQICLDLLAMDIPNPATLPWLEAPPPQTIERARELLLRLAAVDDAGVLTAAGRRMAALPLHPRLARVLIEAEDRGVGEQGCAIAALLSSGQRPPAEPPHPAASDLLVMLESQWEPRTRQVYDQVRRQVKRGSRSGGDESLLLAILTGFPDRVARRRQDDELLLSAGGSALLARSSAVRASALMVAVDVEERRERGLPLVRIASAIEAEWLLDLYPNHLHERNAVEWNRQAERVEAVSAMLYDDLVIEERRGGSIEPEAAGRLLAEKALEAGIDRFFDREQLDAWLARLAFASEHSSVPRLTEEDARTALAELCQGLRSFADIQSAVRNSGLLDVLERRLPPGSRRILEEIAPTRLRLPSGRETKVHYAPDRPPWIASRLQDFFGLRETPRIARGKIPIVVHLLAPNQRPVQTTTDLAGFWERLYPQVRRELSRRYPKHRWPEKP